MESPHPPQSPSQESQIELLEENVSFWMGMALHYWETCCRQRIEIVGLKEASSKQAPFPPSAPLGTT